jgi:hypothetical protein
MTLFVNDLASAQFNASDDLGNGRIDYMNFATQSNGVPLPLSGLGGEPSSVAPATPEASTWAMMLMGLHWAWLCRVEASADPTANDFKLT